MNRSRGAAKTHTKDTAPPNDAGIGEKLILT